ncbi:hypothetical protein [uncultured Desulfovibrio sp.]|uniref:hypothetical protein n=1 Tax=uncultured Desulfovibrio sp. TaxID=167968 RepID=UPI0026317C76|nr:hypothetical protein [uncultured Desulfovibrio sp.]
MAERRGQTQEAHAGQTTFLAGFGKKEHRVFRLGTKRVGQQAERAEKRPVQKKNTQTTAFAYARTPPSSVCAPFRSLSLGDSLSPPLSPLSPPARRAIVRLNVLSQAKSRSIFQRRR